MATLHTVSPPGHAISAPARPQLASNSTRPVICWFATRVDGGWCVLPCAQHALPCTRLGRAALRWRPRPRTARAHPHAHRPCSRVPRRGAHWTAGRPPRVNRPMLVPFRGRAPRIVPHHGGAKRSTSRVFVTLLVPPPWPPSPCFGRIRPRMRRTRLLPRQSRPYRTLELWRRPALPAAGCSVRPPSARERLPWWPPPSRPRSTTIAHGAGSGTRKRRRHSATRGPKGGAGPCTRRTRLWTTL